MGSADGERSAGADASRAGPGTVVSRPALFERLATASRVTVISAAAGCGKTTLVRSWLAATGRSERAAWMPVGRDERDPQRFWLSVVGALRRTSLGPAVIRVPTAAPDLDGWTIVERLLTDAASLADRIWLVIDDVHELDSADVLQQLELLVMRAPTELRFIITTRHDVRLGLHRLRLDGELTEIRAADLRFTLDEARELLDTAGVMLPEPTLALLHERTEGWAAGLRLAALSLTGQRDRQRFVAEFSGSERTVAEYLLAEVLERQPGEVRELLLRTSILDRVNGPLADLLTGGTGGERILQDLEQANAFVVGIDANRSWFRYHRMLAGLLLLELRRGAPDELAELHRRAAEWFAGHGHPVDAIRHAQAARDWDLATVLLVDHWPGLHLNGQAATTHDLLAGFPADVVVADTELAAVFAADELMHGSVEAARRYLGLAERTAQSVSAGRREHARLLLGVVRLMLARQRGNLPAAAEQARQLQEMADAWDLARPSLIEDLRALALLSLDSTEFWSARFAEAERHLALGRVLAQRTRRPFLEFSSLANQAAAEFFLSFERAAYHGMQAVDLAQQHGWTDEPAAGPAYMTLGAVRTWQARLAESEGWVQRAERTIRADAQPLAGMGICQVRAMLEMARGRHAEAVTAFQTAERLAGLLAAPNPIDMSMRGFLLQTLVRAGEIDRAEQALAELGQRDRDRGDMRIALALLRLAQADPKAATTVLAPVLDGSVALIWSGWRAQAFLMEAIARDTLGDANAVASALEQALDLVEPDGALVWFLLHPVENLLRRHAKQGTNHASLIADIQDLLAGSAPASPATLPLPPLEPLSDGEIRVLRYLPTNLSTPEVARELLVSPNTVKTHIRNLYRKLGAHRRSEAVARARAMGLLAPSAQHRRDRTGTRTE